MKRPDIEIVYCRCRGSGGLPPCGGPCASQRRTGAAGWLG
ncbi:Uncharacterized protein PPKH_2028 [Pseudomonas putida]|nr:Uncharacterized protein PPKH_2028 [Pseudomonas putida]